MASKLNPYLTFNGNCAEAMQFYASVLGGTAQIMSFRDSGMDADGVMHASLETPDGYSLFASDFIEGMGDSLQVGNNIQVSISGDDAKLADYFTALGEGGQVLVPLAKQQWGAEYGQLQDKYGIRWHVNIGG
ncbi:VOC family protein [Granulicoccus phenolivorans]|uniref:VOC family protein n=1 Tax=Granulicoccus phenolivorans TaxID=266854 RepID=UPI000407149C|nr:VOC family protein [Granulicoccus phenolivorans]